MSESTPLFNYTHCDVFAAQPYSGNSLAVFTNSKGLTIEQMLVMTQELRHFESIFLTQENDQVSAHIFDLFEELPFAGHPVIGAACTLHKIAGVNTTQTWQIKLQGGRSVSVKTTYYDGHYIGTLNQGQPEIISTIPETQKPTFASAFNLNQAQLSDLPLEVISTGLKYLVVPVTVSLINAKITIPDLEEKLSEIGADFAYLFDVTRFEGRHWNNDGIMEDVATGSAAGVIGAYALKHGLVQPNQSFILKQGHFIERPSEIQVTAYGTPTEISYVTVAGEVSFVGAGKMTAP